MFKGFLFVCLLQYVSDALCTELNRSIIIYYSFIKYEEICSYFHIFITTTTTKSRDISVGIALSYGLDDRGSRVRFPEGAGNFSLHHRVQNSSGVHPASYPMGTRGSFPGVKRTGREANNSHPSSAEFKKCVELYLHSPIRLHGVVLS
jgi:hypothetical protein